MANTQAVIATKWESSSKSQVGVRLVRISGTSEATIGISRIDERVTARKIASRLAPLVMVPIRIILAGSAQTVAVMNIASPLVTPDWSAKAAKPTKEIIRMMAGRLNRPHIPARNQRP
jgi:hypothetical protein